MTPALFIELENTRRISNKSDLTEAVTICLRYLNTKITKPTFLNIAVIDDFEEGFWGFCEAENYDDEITVYITMSSHLTKLQLRETLSHELIHAKQYINNELDESGTMWKGKPWGPSEGQSIHHHSPWEREAYRKEADVNEFMNILLETKNFN